MKTCICFAIVLFSVLITSAQNTFIRYYHFNQNDILYDFEVTTDSGFIVYGQRENPGVIAGNSSVVIKLDSLGEVQWTALLEDSVAGSNCGTLLNFCNYSNFIHQTSDGGYLINKFSSWAGVYWHQTEKLDGFGASSWSHVYYGASLHHNAGSFFTEDDGYVLNSFVGTTSNFTTADASGNIISNIGVDLQNNYYPEDPVTAQLDTNILFTNRDKQYYFGYKYTTNVHVVSPSGMIIKSCELKRYYSMATVTSDNNIFFSGNTDSSSDAFGHWDDTQLLLLNASLDTLWQRTYPSLRSFQTLQLDQSPLGGFVVLLRDMQTDSIYLWGVSALGDSLWLKQIFKVPDYYPNVLKVLPNGYIGIGGEYNNPGGAGDKDFFFMVTDTIGDIFSSTVSGNVYFDVNGNGTREPSEIGISNLLVETEPVGYYDLTDDDGDFEIQAYTISTYNVTAENPLYFYQTSPVAPEYTVVDVTEFDTAYNAGFFAKEVDIQVKDLSVNIRGNIIQTGFSSEMSLICRNIGTSPLTDITVELQIHDGLEVASPYLGTALNDTTIIWYIDSLDIFENDVLDFSVNADAAVIGDTDWISTFILPVETDYNPANNYDTLELIVVGSFDPNNKLVSPAGTGPLGFISPTVESLTYTINFQNIGTAPAQFVHIIDTLDNRFSLHDFTMLGASHEYEISFPANNIIQWHFDNIMLADSASDEEGSKGFVTYSMKTPDNIPLDSSLLNTAYIYFDFNEPVITNTAVSTPHIDPEIVNPNISIDNYFLVQPMPVIDDVIHFNTNLSEPFMLNMYNVLGQTITSLYIDPTASNEILVSGLSAGWYSYTINQTGSTVIVGTLLIIR